jgi:hypothetical protein
VYPSSEVDGLPLSSIIPPIGNTHKRPDQPDETSSAIASSSAVASHGGLPYFGSSRAVPVPNPFTRTKHHQTEAPSSLPASSGNPILGTGIFPPLPGQTKSKQAESEPSSSALPESELPQTGTNGIIPPVVPIPTRHGRPDGDHTKDKTTSDGHIIVGLSTTISMPPTTANPLNPLDTGNNGPERPTLPSNLGLTGPTTGLSVPTPSDLPVVPSGVPSGGVPLPSTPPEESRPHRRPLHESPPLSPVVPSILPSDGIPPSVVPTDMTKQLPTGVLPPGSEVVPTGASTTDGVLPHLGRPGSPPASGIIPDHPKSITDIVPPVNTAQTMTDLGGTGLPTGLPTGAVPPITESVVPPVPVPTSDVIPTVNATDVGGSITSPAGVPIPVESATVPATDLTQQITTGTGAQATDTPPLNPTPPTGLTVTGAGTSVVVPIPSNTAGTSVVITGPDGVTTTSVPPLTATTGNTAQGTTDASDDTTKTSDGTTSTDVEPSSPYGSETATTQPPKTTTAEGDSSTPTEGSTYSTSIDLSSGTTATLGGTGQAPSSVIAPTPPSSVVQSATKTPSDESSTAVVPVVPTDTSKHPSPTDSIAPTGTNTYTTVDLPTTWSFAPTTTPGDGLATATHDGPSTAPTGIPTYLPQLIQPPGGMPEPPANATRIQLGFAYGLNYPYVVNEPQSASQIFHYLPRGIAYGLGIPDHQVVMHALTPYDTSASLNYIMTLAEAYVPTQMVNQLEMSLHMPLSDCYSNPEPPVRTLMNMLDPTIPILPGPDMGGTSSSAFWNPAATGTSSTSDGAPIGGDSGSSNKVRGTSVGIGVGAVCGAAVYGAAMVYVARRYRKKKQGHQRASSVPTAGEMSQTGGMGGFFMSGANGRGSGRGSGSGSGGRGSRTSAGSSNGRSVREQGISAPIMAENSLGWT